MKEVKKNYNILFFFFFLAEKINSLNCYKVLLMLEKMNETHIKSI